MHYDSPFTASPPSLFTLHRQPNNITCCTGPLASPPNLESSAKLSPRRGTVPSEGWGGRPSYEFHLSQKHGTRTRLLEQRFVTRFNPWWPTDCSRLRSIGIVVIRWIEGGGKQVCAKGFWRCLACDLRGIISFFVRIFYVRRVRLLRDELDLGLCWMWRMKEMMLRMRWVLRMYLFGRFNWVARLKFEIYKYIS